MEVRFGDCVYRFAFPALPMVLFNHFRTVSVHTAYIPEAVQKITRFLCTFVKIAKRCCFPDLCKGFKPYCDGSGCRVCLCKAHLSGGLLTGLTLNITQDDALAAADGCRVSIQQICRINGRLLHLHILALEGSQLFLCFHNGRATVPHLVTGSRTTRCSLNAGCGGGSDAL